MTVYRADWICPITKAPIPNGWFAVENGRIARVGEAGGRAPASARDLGRVAVLPALVNAHTHLELSWLRGRVPPAATFMDWIKQVFATRGARAERRERPSKRDPVGFGRRGARSVRIAVCFGLGGEAEAAAPPAEALTRVALARANTLSSA